MKVRALTSVSTARASYSPGEVYDVDADEAAALGPHVEPVAPPKKKAAPKKKPAKG